MIDVKAIELELEIARAARHLYGCMCNLEDSDPASIEAVDSLRSAIDAAESHQNPPAHECIQDPW